MKESKSTTQLCTDKQIPQPAPPLSSKNSLTEKLCKFPSIHHPNSNNSDYLTPLPQTKPASNFLGVERVIVKKEATASTAKTNESRTQGACEEPGQEQVKLDAAGIKAITRNLVYYIHSCRLLFKVLQRLSQTI
jgi:hypothetical protein